MSLRLAGFTTKHWRNGTTFVGRTVSSLIGEQRYDNIRVYKRTVYAEWWYMKQTFFHWLYLNKSDWANFFALLPKPDSSHGFPWKETPSRFSQFAEDTLNSDGYVGWYTYIWVGGAALWSFLMYFWPRRWTESCDFLEERNVERLQYIDGIMSSGYDTTNTFWWGLWKTILTPHEYKRWRDDRFTQFPTSSTVQPCVITINRQNTYYDHHWKGVGNNDLIMG